jgi:hypothetical protein
MSTSRAYLAKRLKAIGRDDLLEAAERGEVSLHAAAVWAGLISQQYVSEGAGSENASKRAAWALLRAERRGLPGPNPKPQPAPENRPAPSAPKFSQDTRDIIKRLVDAGRADLVIAITERRISPFAAARIADRGMSQREAAKALGVSRETVRRDVSQDVPQGDTKRVTKAERREQPAPAQKPEKAKPAVARPDVRALIG